MNIRRKNLFFILPLLMLTLSIATGCSKKVVVTDEISDSLPEDEAVMEEALLDEGEGGFLEEEIGGSDLDSGMAYTSVTDSGALTTMATEEGKLFTIYFDFDKYNLKDSEMEALSSNGDWLLQNTGVKVRVEGHADERGEVEYNIALGDKRSISVKQYLEDRGVDTSRLTTLSYGEERPADGGHDEAAWAKNRRVEFFILN